MVDCYILNGEMNEIFFQLIDKQTWRTSLQKGANKHTLARIVVHNKRNL